MGRLYEVSGHEDVIRLLTGCRSAVEWYDALGTLKIENARQLDAEQTLGSWRYQLLRLAHPLASLFGGDLCTPEDESGDPRVCFHSRRSTQALLSMLQEVGPAFFLQLFPRESPRVPGDSWLYAPLCTFLEGVCKRGNAVVILWEDA